MPGLLHIFHNAVGSVSVAMPAFATWVKGLNTIVNFFKYEALRDRFCEACLEGSHKSFRNLFEFFKHRYIDWCWGSLISCCAGLALLQWPLKLHWDPAKMKKKNKKNDDAIEAGGRDRSDYDEADNAHAVGKIIHDDNWWAFCHMILILGKVFDEAEAWAEGCSCHPHRACWKALAAVMPDWNIVRCPMAGRRGPEMANGRWASVVDGLIDRSEMDVVRLTQGLGADQRVALIGNYRAGSSHMIAELTIKLSMFASLPHKLLGLADYDEAAARHAAVLCLRHAIFIFFNVTSLYFFFNVALRLRI